MRLDISEAMTILIHDTSSTVLKYVGMEGENMVFTYMENGEEKRISIEISNFTVLNTYLER